MNFFLRIKQFIIRQKILEEHYKSVNKFHKLNNNQKSTNSYKFKTIKLSAFQFFLTTFSNITVLALFTKNKKNSFQRLKKIFIAKFYLFILRCA